MIGSFKCKRTKALWEGDSVPAFQAIQKVALRKLDMLNAAKVLSDLKAPPGNHSEPLSGGREGQHSIRIDKQWRICFVWNDGAYDVEIVDYH